MISSLIKTALFLLVILVIGIVAYNYFLGDDQEQQQSQDIIDQVKGLGSSIVSLLSSEKEKYDQGKYEDAINKIGDALSAVKQQVSEMAEGGQVYLDKLNELEQQKAQLESRLQALGARDASQAGAFAEANSGAADQSAEAQQLQAEIQRLAEQTEQLAAAMSQKNN